MDFITIFWLVVTWSIFGGLLFDMCRYKLEEFSKNQRRFLVVVGGPGVWLFEGGGEFCFKIIVAVWRPFWNLLK